MININDLTDDQLAQCADLYVERVINKVLATGQEGDFRMELTAGYDSYKKTYTVEHMFALGRYETADSSKTNSFFKGVEIVLPRKKQNELVAPVERTLAIAAPVADEPVEYTEFDEA